MTLLVLVHLVLIILRSLNTISVESRQSYKGLIYVNMEVNGRVIQAMLNTGAPNNFMAQRETDKLGLNMLESTSKIKAVNYGAMPVRGVVWCKQHCE
ncbi:hypothetical protein Ddye_006909 [Dipteronia dyeriana]|uniref:Uncharacterized protein n=1 Tax=Dipteronia dyeriana TaxID=168575 RepID=A0AAD9XIU5_9ROSI|nr:hypothetical protein Ddye_006909 [Dipteronia dyeriana]